MLTSTPRAGRRSPALTLAALTLTALAACVDEPVVPKTNTATPKASVQGAIPINVVVTNTSGGTDVGSLRWAAEQVSFVGGAIQFDPSLGGKTITLDAGLEFHRETEIVGPDKGVTISGKDQFRIVYSSSVLTLTNVTITKGYAPFGSALEVGALEMYHSTVQDNRSPGSAIYAGNKLVLYNSTVSRNTVGGPAVEYGSGGAIINNSTIAFNAPGAGLGPFGYPSSTVKVTLINSIISNNGQQNCSSFFGFVYEGTNISNDWSCGEVGITVADPMLFPLANNGGPTMTHAISHLGAAFNKGTICWAPADQRYVTRDAKCDVGAFEFTDFTKVTVTIDPNVKVDAANGRALLTGTVTCTRDDVINLALELHQDQKVGKQVVDVHAASTAAQVACGTTAKSWAAKMSLTDGAWQSGSARAMANTYNLPEWVAPASAASAVRISITRK
jgi:hypothetical protein